MNYELRIMLRSKKFLCFALLFGLLLTSYFLLPASALAQDAGQGQFIPCDGVKVPCDFNKLMLLVSNTIGFLVKIATPLATVTIIYAGFIYLTTAVSDKKSKAKKMLLNVVIGFAVLLSAFIIVRTIVNTLLHKNISEYITL